MEISTIHALVLDASSNDAEQTLNVLRNTGVAVRAAQVVNEDELHDALERKNWDVFLARNNCPQLSVSRVAELIQESGRDIPIVLITEAFTPEKITEALASGIQAVVPEDHPDLLRMTVMAELQHLADRRRRKRAEGQLAEAEKRCELLLANSRDAIAYVHDGMHIYANQSYMELFGYDDWEELECIPVLDMIAPAYHLDFKEFMRQQSRKPDETPFEFEGVTASGERFSAVLSMSPASYDGEPCLQLLIRPKTDERALAEKLTELASRDQLTGLASRDYIIGQLTELIHAAQDTHKISALAFIEIDQFHEWEDTVGLSGADEIRKLVASWLEEHAREDDVVARVGDESFALLRKHCTPDELAKEMEHWLSQFSSLLIEANKKTLSGTLSIGIAPVSERLPDAVEAINNAHSVCVRAQSGGGNRVRVFSVAVDSTNIDQQQKKLLRQIQDAMEAERIRLMFQPIVKMHGENKEFFQVQVRVLDDSGEPVPLKKLFPIVEGSELALRLEYWVITQAFKALKEHRESHRSQTQFFVQLSAAMLEHDKTVDFILKTWKQSKLPANAVMFMVNETDAATRLKRVIHLGEALGQHQIRLALSHFGGSLSSETILQHVPVEHMPYVQLEHDIVVEDLQQDEGMARLEKLVQLAKQHERKIIVPMIENAQMLAQIWPLGVDYVQGYYVSSPLPHLYFDFGEASF